MDQNDQPRRKMGTAHHLDALMDDYRAAWNAALAGGTPPSPEAFLSDLSESDRAIMRLRLEAVDREQRERLSKQPDAVNMTVHFERETDAEQNQSVDTAVLGPGANTPPLSDFVVDESIPKIEKEKRKRRRPPAVAGYEIVGELGRGGMGVVYKARQKGLNRLVALKMLLAGSHADDMLLARFQTEAEAVARLQHPNIVQIYEVGQHEGLPYFSLEFVDGQSLSQKLGGNPQPPREAAQLVAVLARAMHYAHDHGIVHRDLKPANILLTAAGVPKIADFGLAKQLEGDSSQTKSGTLMGTPNYFAPEQARGAVKEIGPAADTYALGAILYDMLTGRPPFVAANVMDTIMYVLRHEPVPPSQLQAKVPRDLETICLKCLQKEVPQRYATAGDLADDLDRFLAGEPIRARPIGSMAQLWRWCRRNPRVSALAASTFALLVAGVIGSLGAAVTINQERKQKERERDAADVARTLAEDRKNEADLANQNAQKHADEAMKQGKLALSAFGTLVDEVQKQIGDSPGTQDLKLKLLETALEGLEKVAKSDETSRLLGQSTAAAYMKVGQLFQQLGQSEKAFAQYQKCHDIIQALAAKDPEGDVAQANLAATFTMLGEMSLELRRDMQASLDHYQRALAIRRRLNGRPLSDKLNPVKVKQEFAESCTRVGVTYLRLGEPEKARGYFQEALQLREEMAAAGTDPMAQLDVARSFNALGEVEFRTRDWPAAKEHFAKALALCDQVQRAQPNNPRFQLELANTLGNFGVFDTRTGDVVAAPKHYAAGLTLMQALVDADPRHALYRRYLGLVHYRIGTLARRRNDTETAQRSDRACLEIREKLAKEDAKNERRQIELLLALPRCGQHTRAAELAAEVQNRKSVDREVLVEIAQCLAQCAAAAGGQKELHEQYTQRALEALRQAIAKGYKDVVVLETEPDFDALRPHAGYQSLLAGLKKG